MNYRKYGTSIKNFEVIPTKERFNEIFSPIKKGNSNVVIPVRDESYWNWRIFSSPNFNSYRLFSIDVNSSQIGAVIKLHISKGFKSIDILKISDYTDNQNVISLISMIALWAIDRNYSHMRFYTNSKLLSNSIGQCLKSVVKNPGFMFHANNSVLESKLSKAKWNWEMIDGDLEANT